MMRSQGARELRSFTEGLPIFRWCPEVHPGRRSVHAVFWPVPGQTRRSEAISPAPVAQWIERLPSRPTGLSGVLTGGYAGRRGAKPAQLSAERVAVREYPPRR